MVEIEIVDRRRGSRLDSSATSNESQKGKQRKNDRETQRAREGEPGIKAGQLPWRRKCTPLPRYQHATPTFSAVRAASSLYTRQLERQPACPSS